MASNAPGSQQVVLYANLASHLRSVAPASQNSGRVTLVRAVTVPVAGTAFLGLAASPQTFAIINSGHGRDVLLPPGASVNPLQVLRCRQSYVNGFLIFSRGSPPASGPCTQCHDRGTSLPFSGCYHAPGHFGGACASCKWTDHASRCSLYNPDSRGLPSSGSASAGASRPLALPSTLSVGSAASSSALVRSAAAAPGARTSTPVAGASLSFAVPIGNPLLQSSLRPSSSSGPSSALVRTVSSPMIDLTGLDDDDDYDWGFGTTVSVDGELWDSADLPSAAASSALVGPVARTPSSVPTSFSAPALSLSSASNFGLSRSAAPTARSSKNDGEEDDSESDTEYPVPPLRMHP